MSKLLINEPPLQVLPSLAAALGLNEAIVIQQLHYWLENNKTGTVIDGEKWVFNTYEEWATNFPFWSLSTIKRIFASLEEKGIIVSAQLNRHRHDHTKYYRIDYVQLDTIDGVKMTQSEVSDWDNLNKNTKTTTETTIDASIDLPIDWQIASSNKPITSMPMTNENADILFLASQYCHGASDVLPFVAEFMRLTGHMITKSVASQWRKTIREDVINAGYSLTEFQIAVQEHLNKRDKMGNALSVKSPASVTYCLKHVVEVPQGVYVAVEA